MQQAISWNKKYFICFDRLIMTKRRWTIALASFYLTKKKQVKINLTKHKKDHVRFNNGTNREKEKGATTAVLRKF